MATCVAEFVALYDTSKKAFFTRAVLVFFQLELSNMRVNIFDENEGSKAIADNPSSLSRSKHNDVKLHFVLGLTRTGEVRILHVGTEETPFRLGVDPHWGSQNFAFRNIIATCGYPDEGSLEKEIEIPGTPHGVD